MRAFVDTSAFYALMAEEDLHHERAIGCFEELSGSRATLVSSNYVLLECASLIQRRRGFEPARAFLAKAADMLDVVWIGDREHQEAIALWTRSRSRTLSLVDCSSIAVMRQRALRCAVAFDAHFAQAGFDMLPRGDRVAERQAVYRARRSLR